MSLLRPSILVLALALSSIAIVCSANEEDGPIRVGTLKQVVTLVRHGVRYVSTMKFDTENDRKHIGELMPAGRRQMYHLGQILRKLYCDDVFLSSTYLPSTIYLRATERNRTIESGMCFAAGMYPNDNDEVSSDIFQEYLDAPFDDPIMSEVIPVTGRSPFLNGVTSIPVHSMPENTDRSLSPIGHSCNMYSKKVEENIASAVMQEVMKEYEDVLAQFRGLIEPYLDPKRPPGPLTQLEIHYWRDGVLCRKISGASSIPPEYLGLLENFYDPVTGVDTPLLRSLREFSEITSFVAFLKDEESLRLGSTSFFNELLGIFNQRAGDLKEFKKYQTKFVGYFAHELTVKMVLRALEVSSWECQLVTFKKGQSWPKESPCLTETTQLGENIIFELRQAPDEEDGELFVVLRFNGKYLYFGCDHKSNGDVIYARECNLQTFEKFARRFMIQDLDHACEYGENGKKEDENEEEEQPFNWSSFFVGFFLAIIAAGIAYKLQLNKRQAEGASNNPTNNHYYNNSQEMRDIVQPLHNQP